MTPNMTTFNINLRMERRVANTRTFNFHKSLFGGRNSTISTVLAEAGTEALLYIRKKSAMGRPLRGSGRSIAG